MFYCYTHFYCNCCRDEKDKEDRPKKEGSTRLPKYPEVKVPAGDMSTRKLYYSDVPMLRYSQSIKVIIRFLKKYCQQN